VSGSRDCTTRLWNIETQKQIFSKKIDRNVITSVKWLQNETNLFFESSEDLILRIFDIRLRPFAACLEFNAGPNFATTCDILSK
jgi:WD40 repeat protein